MPRKAEFTTSAQVIQDTPDATVTFRAISVGEYQEWLQSPGAGLLDLLRDRVLDWHLIEDDNGDPLPSPADDPGALEKLYHHELRALHRLLVGSDPN